MSGRKWRALLQKRFVEAGKMTFLGVDGATALLFAAKNDDLQGWAREPPLKMHLQGQVGGHPPLKIIL